MNIRFCIPLFLIILFSCMDKPIQGNQLSLMGFYAPPEKIIEELKDRAGSYHEHFMLGLAYEELKDYKSSIRHFADSCFKTHRSAKMKLYPQPVYSFVTGFHFKSKYYDEAVYKIALLFYTFGEYRYVLKFLDLVSDDQPGLYLDAVLLQAKTYASLKEYDKGIKVLKNSMGVYGTGQSGSIILIRLASLYEKTARVPQAVETYMKLFEKDEQTWQSQIAIKQVLALISSNQAELAADKKFPFAGALYHAKNFSEAVSILEGLKKEKASPEIDMLLVRCLAGLNKFDDAAAIAESYSTEPATRTKLQAVMAGELRNMGLQYKAAPLYEKIAGSGIEPEAREALKQLARNREDRRMQGYRDLLIQYKTRYRDAVAEYFLWLLGRDCIRDKRYADAVPYLTESLELNPAGDYSDSCRFWLYKVLLKNEKHAEAEEILKDLIIINPDSSYTWLAIKNTGTQYGADRLEEKYREAKTNSNRRDMLFYHTLLFYSEKDLEKRDARIPDLNDASLPIYGDVAKNIHTQGFSSRDKKILRSLEKFFEIGFTEAINREINFLSDDPESLREKYECLAGYSARYGNYSLAVYSLLELFKILQCRENAALLPRDMAMMLYPRAFQECLTEYSPAQGVEENRLLSVIKAESNFNNRAVSSAGAAGLMQLMPGTAGDIARKEGINEYNLMDPCTSIHFGARYLSWLMKYFNGNYQYAIAGYNAGAGNVDKWKKSIDTQDPDYFMEFMPFAETRGYVLRTGKFFTIYEMLYH